MTFASASMKVIYGGTFDPFHNGHLAIAQSASHFLEAPVTLLPAADPPHRPPPGASAEQRLAMLQAAVADAPNLTVDRRELGRAGKSYTVDTLRELRGEIGPKTPLALLLGADSFLALPSWHQWRELFTLAHLVVAQRAGSAMKNLSPELALEVASRWVNRPAELKNTPAGCVLRLQQPLYDASATEVRHIIASGGDWQALVPPPVATLIRVNGLYRVGAL